MSTERVPDQLKAEDIGGAFIITAPNGRALYITHETILRLASEIRQAERLAEMEDES